MHRITRVGLQFSRTSIYLHGETGHISDCVSRLLSNQVNDWVTIDILHQSMRVVAPAVSSAGATDPRSDRVATNESVQPLRKICGRAQTNTVLILVPTSDRDRS